jgi:hypothetical protein
MKIAKAGYEGGRGASEVMHKESLPHTAGKEGKEGGISIDRGQA